MRNKVDDFSTRASRVQDSGRSAVGEKLTVSFRVYLINLYEIVPRRAPRRLNGTDGGVT